MLTRNEGGSCRIRTISSLALSLAVALSCGRLALTDVFVEPLAPEPPLVKFTPRGNSEFIGRQTVGPVTRRFEMYDPHSPEALKTLKEMGFTQVILDWPNLHRDATAIGLDVVLPNWWTDKTKPEEIERGIELAKQVDPARLAGFSVMDEPERNSPETPFSFYTDLYDQMRPRFDREFPGVRLEISHSGPYRSWDQRYYDHFSFLYEAADVMRIMPFPDLNEGPLSDVFFMILRSRELMRIAGRELPLVVILQAWVLPPESKLPEIAELRVMAWQAMLAGVETISFFEYNTDVWSQTPGFHDQFADLMQELIGASNRLRDATIRSRIDAEGVLHAQVSWPNGRTESILVNTNRTNVGNLAPLAVVETSACQSRAPVCPQICAPGPIQQPDCRAFPRPALRSRCVPTRCDD